MKLEVPVIGILRGVEASFFREIMDASFGEGLQAIEITMNTDSALNMVAECRGAVPSGKLLGMGTVRNIEEAKMAVDAGAMFLVTPNTDREVITYGVSCSVPVIAGALTPTEVYAAWSSGASMVKLFPCNLFGPGYLRDLAGPFEQIPLVAVGGVTLDNMDDYFRAGAAAIGTSSALFGKKALKDRNIEELRSNVNKFISLCPDTKNQL